MKYVNYEMCRNDPDHTPNVAMIRVEGVRLIRGRVPIDVRRELMAAVKAGTLGRLRRDGLMPEAFFHPNSRAKAIDLRAQEAGAAVTALQTVMINVHEPRYEATHVGYLQPATFDYYLSEDEPDADGEMEEITTFDAGRYLVENTAAASGRERSA